MYFYVSHVSGWHRIYMVHYIFKRNYYVYLETKWHIVVQIYCTIHCFTQPCVSNIVQQLEINK